MSRSRAYCLTLNNYSEAEWQSLLATDCTYLVIGQEIAPETLTPHLQGYFYFPTLKSLKQVKEINGRAHWEAAKGDVDSNYKYCTKEGHFEERGTKPMSQKRKGEANSERWDLALKKAREGDFEGIPSDIYIKYRSNLLKIHAESQGKRESLDGELENEWIWGASGVGKSRSVLQRYPDAFVKDLNQWWDGYDRQETVVIEDMDPFYKRLAREFKIWGDRYAFPAQVKGGAMVIRPKRIIVTSQYKPEEIWDDKPTLDAINRRYKVITCLPMSHPLTLPL